MIRNCVMPRKVGDKFSGRRGTALIEFAVIAPIFFVLVLGIVEFGRLMMVQEILVNAARVGARQAILYGSTDSQIQTTITNYMSAANISGYTATISPDLSTNPGSGTAITVTVSVPTSQVSWTGGFPVNLLSTTLSANVVMIHE